MNPLVEKMLDADFAARNAGDWRNMSPENHQKLMQEGMMSALRVAVDAAYVTIDRFQDIFSRPEGESSNALVVKIAEAVRRDLLPPPHPPTLAERIKPILDRWITQHTPETRSRIAQEIAELIEKESS